MQSNKRQRAEMEDEKRTSGESLICVFGAFWEHGNLGGMQRTLKVNVRRRTDDFEMSLDLGRILIFALVNASQNTQRNRCVTTAKGFNSMSADVI